MTPSLKCCVAAVVLLVNDIHSGFHSAAAASEAAHFDVEQVINAWQERQLRVSSLKFTWRQLPSKTGRWRSYQADWQADSNTSSNEPENVLSIQGESICYESNRWYVPITMEYAGFTESDASYYRRDEYFWRTYFHDTPLLSFRDACRQKFSHSVHQKRSPRRFTSLRDGEQRIDFFSRSDGKYPQAAMFDWVSTAESLSELQDDLYFRPILLTYRPIHPGAGSIHPDECRIINQQSYANGRNCLILVETRSDKISCKHWVDPERDFVIVRSIIERDGKARAQLDIAYSSTPHEGWVPSHWSAMLIPFEANYLGHDWLVHDATAEVSEFVLNTDTAIPNIIIPDGTFVLDHAKREAYITLIGNQKRILTESELRSRDTTYDKLLGRWSYEFLNDMRLWPAAGMVICLVLIVMSRRRSSRSTQPPSDSTEFVASPQAHQRQQKKLGRLLWMFGLFLLWGTVNSAFLFFSDKSAKQLSSLVEFLTTSTSWIWWVAFAVFAMAAWIQFTRSQTKV